MCWCPWMWKFSWKDRTFWGQLLSGVMLAAEREGWPVAAGSFSSWKLAGLGSEPGWVWTLVFYFLMAPSTRAESCLVDKGVVCWGLVSFGLLPWAGIILGWISLSCGSFCQKTCGINLSPFVSGVVWVFLQIGGCVQGRLWNVVINSSVLFR